MYTKTFMEVICFITVCVVFIVGVICSCAWIMEHPVALLVALLIPVAYYGFALLAITTNTTSADFWTLEGYVKHGPLKDYALSRLQGIIGGMSRNEVLNEIDLCVRKWSGVSTDTLRLALVRLEQVSDSPEDFEKNAVSMLRNAKGDERVFIVRYLEPYTKKRIIDATTNAELNDLKAAGLVLPTLENILNEKVTELYVKRVANATTTAELNRMRMECPPADIYKVLAVKEAELYDRDGRMVPRRA